MRILLIEDEPVLGDAVASHLRRLGHAVDWVGSLGDADAALAAAPHAIILLDLGLPDGEGTELLRRMRASSDRRPVVIITAHDKLGDRILGLNLGADDYLVKPFDLDELAARISAVGRRYNGNPNPSLPVGSIEIDFAGRRAIVAGHPVDLTKREWALLSCLAERPSAVRSKRELEDAMYAFDGEVESNTVEAYVSRLRKKLGRDAIVTLRGLGYRLGQPK
jgi:two-component system OmpR family response regulator